MPERTKKLREAIFWLIPWCVVGVLALWKDYDQQGDIKTNTTGIAANRQRITATEAIVVVEASDRFTMSNFKEWVHAFMKANPDVTGPDVDFSAPPPAMLPVDLLKK